MDKCSRAESCEPDAVRVKSLHTKATNLHKSIHAPCDNMIQSSIHEQSIWRIGAFEFLT